MLPEITAISHSYQTTGDTGPTITGAVYSLRYTLQMYLPLEAHTEHVIRS